MASLTDSPGLVSSRQTSARDQSLLHRAYRRAKQQGDFGGALRLAQQGDSMGLAIGRPVHSEEINGTGEKRFGDDMQMLRRLGQNPQQQGGGLGGFDFRQAKDRGAPGVGGYDFNQQRMRQRQLQPVAGTGYQQGDGAQGPMTPQGFSSEKPLLPSAVGVQEQVMSDGMEWNSVTGMSPAKNIDPGFSQATPSQLSSPQSSSAITMTGGNRYQGNQLVGADGSTNSGSIGGYDFSQTKLSPLRPVSEGGHGHAAYPSIHNVDRRTAFSRAWQNARSQNDRDAIVAKAHGLGVQMNADLARPSLERSGVIQPQNQAAPVRSSRYIDSPEYASARSRFNEMKTAFAQPRPADSIDYRARNAQIDRDVADMRRASAEDTARYEKIPGWNDPDAYAAARIAEVRQNDARNEANITQHQSDMRETTGVENEFDRNMPFSRGYRPQTPEILDLSRKKFGVKPSVTPTSEKPVIYRKGTGARTGRTW